MAEKVHLDEFERRVLGVLMEKALGQPDYYPMTLNALLAACNQKQNRNPVMSLDDDCVHETLERLRERRLVTLVFPPPGARTDRYKHEADTFFGWQPRERAVMAELMLRGPQTLGELRTHCSRLIPFDSLDAVSMVIDCLQQYDPPVVKALPREPGRSAIRYTHLLYPEDEQPTGDTVTRESTAASRSSSATGTTRSVVSSPGASDSSQSQIKALRSQLENLEQRVAAIEARMGAG